MQLEHPSISLNGELEESLGAEGRFTGLWRGLMDNVHLGENESNIFKQGVFQWVRGSLNDIQLKMLLTATFQGLLFGFFYTPITIVLDIIIQAFLRPLKKLIVEMMTEETDQIRALQGTNLQAGEEEFVVASQKLVGVEKNRKSYQYDDYGRVSLLETVEYQKVPLEDYDIDNVDQMNKVRRKTVQRNGYALTYQDFENEEIGDLFHEWVERDILLKGERGQYQFDKTHTFFQSRSDFVEKALALERKMKAASRLATREVHEVFFFNSEEQRYETLDRREQLFIYDGFSQVREKKVRFFGRESIFDEWIAFKEMVTRTHRYDALGQVLYETEEEFAIENEDIVSDSVSKKTMTMTYDDKRRVSSKNTQSQSYDGLWQYETESFEYEDLLYPLRPSHKEVRRYIPEEFSLLANDIRFAAEDGELQSIQHYDFRAYTEEGLEKEVVISYKDIFDQDRTYRQDVIQNVFDEYRRKVYENKHVQLIHALDEAQSVYKEENVYQYNYLDRHQTQWIMRSGNGVEKEVVKVDFEEYDIYGLTKHQKREMYGADSSWNFPLDRDDIQKGKIYGQIQDFFVPVVGTLKKTEDVF